MSTWLSVLLAGHLLGQTPLPAQSGSNDALIDATKRGQAARVRELLSAGAQVDAADRRGFTPLMWAAATGDIGLLGQLVERGAALDRRANDGSTALMLAAANGFTEVVRALLLRGANAAAARNGVTPRQLAVQRGHSDLAMLLERAEGLGARLVQAVNEGHDALVRQLLALGAPVNVAGAQGATVLMIAARNGDLGILQALLARGADASVRDNQGRTALDWAELSPATGKFVTPFLLERGASRDAPRRLVPAQSPQVTSSLRALADALARVRLSSAPVQAAQRRANNALQELQKLSTRWPAESPADYRDSLAGEVAALEAAIKVGNLADLAATIQSLADDLEVKLEHCIKSGGKLGGSVAVRVRTLQGSQEIKSWQVFYMPRIFEASPNASPDLFPQLSSPTEETLVPGRYLMWVRDPATARVGERTVVKVGEGRADLLLDLPVPAVPAR